MSQRAHFWIRLVALGVIVAISCMPRSGHGPGNPDALDGTDPSHSAQVARQ